MSLALNFITIGKQEIADDLPTHCAVVAMVSNIERGRTVPVAGYFDRLSPGEHGVYFIALPCDDTENRILDLHRVHSYAVLPMHGFRANNL